MKFLIALALGAVSAFAFEPFALWPLMPLAFAGLCHLVAKAQRLRGALAIGWGFGVGQFAVGLNWIATAFTFQAAMPAWLGWIAVVVLSFYLALYPMLAAGVAWRLGRTRPLALVVALAGTWILTEWLRATVFTGFAWNPASAVLVETPWLDSIRFVGTYALSGLVVLAGGALWLAWRRETRGAAVIAAVVVALALVPPAALSERGEPRPIRIVQPNIGQDTKWDPAFEALARAKLDRLSEVREGERELVFWPEAAVTRPLSDNREGAGPFVTRERNGATREIDRQDLLMTGGIALRSTDGVSADRFANSVFVLGPGGSFVGRYDKAHLVPYGEYLPMRTILSSIGLSRLVPGEGDFAPGPGAGTLTLPEGWGKAGFQICYEIIFSGEVVNRAHRPDFIFNPSNDAWFGRWGPPQHLAQARMRAAEEGLPVVRSTPTGISALIDARGAVVDSIPWHKAGIIWSTMPPTAEHLSPFALGGNLIAILLGLLLVAAAIALGRRRRYSAT